MSHYPPYGPSPPPYGPPHHGPPHHEPPHHGPPHHGPPPHGPPPPHYHGYPPPPPASYAYVPMPVMMPAYPPAASVAQPENPTYITNYIMQPPQTSTPQTSYSSPPYTPYSSTPQTPYTEPVKVVEDVIDWVPATPATAQNFTTRAVVAGHEGWDGSPLWVIRAYHNGDLLPGKLAIKHRAAYVPNAAKEIPVHNFEVLCAQPNTVRWMPSSNGQVPVGAIVAGNTLSAEPLYIGRARHSMSLTPGKVHPSHQCCYISYGGNEVSHKHYEVLCKIVG